LFSAAIIQLARDIFIISWMRTFDSKNLRVFKENQGSKKTIVSTRSAKISVPGDSK